MNIRKGFFRLTLILSVLCGISIPLFSDDNAPGFRSSDIKITISLPSDWDEKTLQKKLNSIDELLTRPSDAEKSGTPEEALASLRRAIGRDDYSRLTSKEQRNVKRRLREQIISDEKKLPKDRERRNYYVSSGPDWRELSFLVFIGFAPVWLIYAFTRWIIIAFIVGGFKGKSPKGGENDKNKGR